VKAARRTTTTIHPEQRRITLLTMAATIAVIAILPYLQTHAFDFIAYDDNSYITENSMVQRGLTWEGFCWSFTTFHAANWHPLTWLSHMLDCSMFKGADGSQWAGGHHVVNAILHAFNAALLFGVLLRMTRAAWRSALVAAMFAVHPLHVESVAWVSERKDVLSALFGFASIWFYVGFAKRKRAVEYVLMILFYAMSLLAKPMFVTLPCLLLLLDWWPLRRWAGVGGAVSTGRLLLEKVPLVVIAGASCVVTVVAQRAGGAVFPLEAMSLGERIFNAVVAYAAYIGMMFWPVDLAVLYPHPGSWDGWRVAASATVIVAITAIVIKLSRKRSAFVVGWFWYLGTLVPVIGLVQVGAQAMADRYTYVPLIGLFIVIAWAVPPVSDRRRIAPVAVCTLLILGVLTWRSFVQVKYWRDSFTLFERTLAITDRNYIIHNNLGFAHKKVGGLARAIAHYRTALEIKPNYALTHENLGNALVASDQPEQAVLHLMRAVELRPDVARTHANLGAALFQAGRIDEAEQALKRSIRLQPDYMQGHLKLGRLYSSRGQGGQAIGAYRAALAIEQTPEAHVYLGIELAKQRKYDEAIAEFHAALRLRPGWRDAEKLAHGAMVLKEREKQP
jgi:tetratricopeptide (TPR) repeat protein